jgi:hypothetical protein
MTPEEMEAACRQVVTAELARLDAAAEARGFARGVEAAADLFVDDPEATTMDRTGDKYHRERIRALLVTP